MNSKNQNLHQSDLEIIGNRAARPLRADLLPNLFSELRREQHPLFVDALDSSPDDAHISGNAPPDAPALAIFAPGCVLSAASAPLLDATYRWLLAHELVSGITMRCCGNILKSVATTEEREDYIENLKATFAKNNVSKIIVACNNCFKAYSHLALNGIEIVPLSEVLAIHNSEFKIHNLGQCSSAVQTDVASAGGMSFCVHDSCPDRQIGRFANSVRSLFAGVELREMKHCGDKSLCCGLGKMRAMTHPAAAAKINAARLDEFAATGADILVTYCTTCTQAFQPETGLAPASAPCSSGRQNAAPTGANISTRSGSHVDRRGGILPPAEQGNAEYNQRYAYHYLELLFNIPIDWKWFLAAYKKHFNELQELADEPQS